MNVRALILKKITQKGEVKSAEIIKETDFSRAYVNRFFQHLQRDGKIILIGKANQARYVSANREKIAQEKSKLLSTRRILRNKSLHEDIVIEDLKRETGIWMRIPKNVSSIVDYAFTEMLNNAIEHSQSPGIDINFKRDKEHITFDVIDKGVGIFTTIRRKRKLASNVEAIEDLLKGKQTTAPKEHTGEGIFFTSKVADVLIIESDNKKLEFNNIVEDVFIRDRRSRLKGTKVSFTIALLSVRKLGAIFRKYTDDSFTFSKTSITVGLYKTATGYISRSQGRRVMSGLEKFKTIVLDFKDVATVGQAFADEVFRIWQNKYPAIKIIPRNADENVKFMINRAIKGL